jgi:hypothetical protein
MPRIFLFSWHVLQPFVRAHFPVDPIFVDGFYSV